MPVPAGDFDDWVESVTERLDPFMAWLGVVFALLVGYELAVELTASTAQAISIAGWAIWAAFALEFGLKLAIAPRKLAFVRRHWFQAAALLLPTLRLFRFVRLLRIGRAFPAARVVSSAYRSAGTAARLFRSRLGYLAALTTVVGIAIAELAYLFERDADDGIFGSFGDALLWSFSAVLGQQADPVPASLGAKLAMLLGFVFGLSVVAALAATIGAFLVEGTRERARAARASERLAELPRRPD